jgi:hypothetical protein
MRKFHRTGETSSRKQSYVVRVIIEKSDGIEIARKFSGPRQAMKFARKAAGWPKLELVQVRQS